MAESPAPPTARPSEPRKWLFRTLAAGIPLLLGGVLVGIVLVQQGWLRYSSDGQLIFSRPPLYLQEPGHEITGHRYLYDSKLGWRNIPGWTATTRGFPLTINSLGLRDREHPYVRPSDTRRILVLGDSYAWGYGVGDQDVFAHVLEQNLRSAGMPWEVINSGVSGWGTDQQYLFLQDEGLRYAPEIVVVAFFIGNDIDNNSAANQYALHKPVFLGTDLVLANVPVPRPHQQPDPRLAQRLAKVDPLERTFSILEGMNAVCEKHECQLVLMKFGIFLARELPYARDLQRQFEAARVKANLPMHYLDLDDVFQAKEITANALLVGNDDGHWNAYGHRQVAEILQQFLVDQGLLD